MASSSKQGASNRGRWKTYHNNKLICRAPNIRPWTFSNLAVYQVRLHDIIRRPPNLPLAPVEHGLAAILQLLPRLSLIQAAPGQPAQEKALWERDLYSVCTKGCVKPPRNLPQQLTRFGTRSGFAKEAENEGGHKRADMKEEKRLALPAS
jgi:hypothetical protein